MFVKIIVTFFIFISHLTHLSITTSATAGPITKPTSLIAFRVVIMSVNYRRASENPYPCTYDDAATAHGIDRDMISVDEKHVLPMQGNNPDERRQPQSPAFRANTE
ncbi:hypothetical protein VitviT2T_005226 [Vitis vinifera]|uniref:Secreted protein n=1 Tax=Vitis vinifera TaxID=29760 RepID=A0ABY9BTG4_VITVI|nr:hypothetical protein VitviT2T_005226 [Vitis vinifera]